MSLTTSFLLLMTSLTDTTHVRTPGCPNCTVVMQRTRVVQDADLPVAARAQQVVRHPSGRLLLIDDSYRTAPVLVDSSGRLHPLTRRGSGPGEWQHPAFAWTIAPDSFALYDPVLRRITAYAWTGHAGPSVAAPDAFGGVALAPGRFLLSAVVATPQSVGRTYFLQSWQGTTGSWVEAGVRVLPGQLYRHTRLLARTEDGVWSAQVYDQPVLEHRRTDGTLLHTTRLEMPWYWSRPAGTRINTRAPLRPSSQAVGLGVKDSLVYVLYTASASGWERAMVQMRTPDGLIYAPRNGADVTDHWLVVLHARTGALIATQRIDDAFSGFTNEGDLIRRSSRDDMERLELYRVSLRSTTSPTRTR